MFHVLFKYGSVELDFSSNCYFLAINFEKFQCKNVFGIYSYSHIKIVQNYTKIHHLITYASELILIELSRQLYTCPGQCLPVAPLFVLNHTLHHDAGLDILQIAAMTFMYFLN